MEYSITKAEINEKPLLEYTGTYSLIATDEELAKVLPSVQAETLLGFDTETRPAFRKGESYLPSLLQLGGESHVWLFQLQKLSDLNSLFSILANPDICKTGVAIARDISELQDLQEFEPAGFEDVGLAAEQLGFRNTGLRPLSALLLGGRISKGAQVSNWATSHLSQKQELYAATDAWISRELYLALHALQKKRRARA
ncbi:MAG: 3'-5' exonuclease domain-containing protein 2 [Kiritimatiellae bacterium]|jgi:ribonuclease D|nr:3'-5' exonuclease domain-containing protein 2 [Kiritimatiellia bacterium]